MWVKQEQTTHDWEWFLPSISGDHWGIEKIIVLPAFSRICLRNHQKKIEIIPIDSPSTEFLMEKISRIIFSKSKL